MVKYMLLDAMGASAPMQKNTGLVLAGGRGERFGVYKAIVQSWGEPLILRPLRVFQELSGEVIIAHGGKRQLELLREVCPEAIFVADDETGPLGGLLAGFRRASKDWVMVAPCDTPLLSVELYRELLSRARRAEGCVVRLHGTANPVIGVYRKDAFLDAALEVASGGGRAPAEVLSHLNLVHMDEDALREMPFGTACLLDVDTPEDLERLDKYLAEGP